MLPPPVSNLAIPAWGHGRGLDGTQMLICKQHTCKNLLKFANRWLLKDLRGVAEKYNSVWRSPECSASSPRSSTRPVLGRMPVKTVRRDDVERFMHDVAAGKTASQGEDQATRSLDRTRRSWCRRAHRGTARRDLHLRRAPGPSDRQSGAWRRQIRRRPATATADR